MWYDQLVHQLKWSTVAVIPDSYAGVFPEGAIGPLFFEYNFCSSGFLSEELYTKCMSQELTNMDIMSEYLSKSPEIPVSFIQVRWTDLCAPLLHCFPVLILNSCFASPRQIACRCLFTSRWGSPRPTRQPPLPPRSSTVTSMTSLR